MRRGFTLLELVVAAVILEVGLVGVAGLLLLARRTADEARRWEEAVATSEWVFDSLTRAGAAGSGERRAPWGLVRWAVSADGRLELDARDQAGHSLLSLEGSAVGRSP